MPFAARLGIVSLPSPIHGGVAGPSGGAGGGRSLRQEGPALLSREPDRGAEMECSVGNTSYPRHYDRGVSRASRSCRKPRMGTPRRQIKAQFTQRRRGVPVPPSVVSQAPTERPPRRPAAERSGAFRASA
ncbi:hypothetical protein GCM10008174_32340 [Methylopila turkensis]|uniref:Uncharacterized protein n=1 Tax=Methylopila turkensis TaxID=1437816 RepID=A0A9W6N8F0_9HYPH|nr:hypothetical protein GCM10008174_32340 [Methylopila turkensis]